MWLREVNKTKTHTVSKTYKLIVFPIKYDLVIIKLIYKKNVLTLSLVQNK